MGFREPQTPGLGGIDELTSSEEITVQEIDAISHAAGTLIVSTSTIWEGLVIGNANDVLSVNAGGTALEWTSSSGMGDVTAASNLGDNLLIRGDGAGKGVQNSGISITDSDIMTGGNAGGMTVANIAGAAFTTIQHMQDTFHSAGWLSGGGITDDANGTITVAAGEGLIRATDNATVQILFMDWAAESGANVNLADNDISWVYVEYNAGSPRVIATTTERTDFQTNVLLAVISREGTTLHINANEQQTVGDHANNMIRRLKGVMPYGHVSGGILSAPSGLKIALTAGSFWRGLTEFSTSAVDTNAAGTFSYYYKPSGSWIKVATQTDIDNTQYNNFGTGLATLDNNKYGVHWVYLEADDDDIAIVYGLGNYTLAQAEDAQPPSTIPEFLQIEGILAGKIIVKKSDAGFTQLESAFETTFQGSLATDHGGLAGLAGDDHTQYLLEDGSRALSANWNVGAFDITANTFIGALTGQADTVVTNADLTGIVTSSGNATAIADKAIAIAKLADGTDGELITWSATGVIAVVTVGTNGQVLTSGGVGVAPTFEDSVSGASQLDELSDVVSATNTNRFALMANGTTGYVGRALQAADIPTLNQNTTGSAATLTTPRAIYGNNFDGSAALTQIIASTYGGTGNGFTKFTGPTTAERTFTLPNASATLLYSGGALGTPVSGSAANLTSFPTLNQNTTGSAGTLNPGRTINGVAFDGSTNITVTAAAGTLTGTTLKSTVVTSSLTSVGTLTGGSLGSGFTDVVVDRGGTGRSTHTAYAVLCGGTTTTAVQQSITSVGTSGQVLTSAGAGALPTFEDATGGGGGITWEEVTGTSQAGAVDTGYIINNASLVTITIPTTAALGSVIRIAGSGAGGWKVAQNSGETINFGDQVTTTGVGGSLASVNRYDAIELVCITANTVWTIISSQGNITVV